MLPPRNDPTMNALDRELTRTVKCGDDRAGGFAESFGFAQPRVSQRPTGGRTGAFQTAMQHKFISAVERLSGRNVLSFISDHHVGRDMEIELFMLKPLDSQTIVPPPG